MAGLFGLIPIYYDLLVERVGNKKDEFGTSYASMPCVDIPARGNFAVAVVGLVVKHNVFFAVKKIKVSNTFPTHFFDKHEERFDACFALQHCAVWQNNVKS